MKKRTAGRSTKNSARAKFWGGGARTSCAGADVEKGVALLEVEILEGRAVNGRGTEVQHALSQRHIDVGIRVVLLRLVTLIKKVATVDAAKGVDDLGRRDATRRLHRLA